VTKRSRRFDDVDSRLIAESIPQIVWMSAPDGATEYFNERGSRYTGMPREANTGWNWLQLIHPDDRDRAERSWREAVGREAPYTIEHRIRHHDGEYRRNEVRAMPVRNADGRVVRWIGTVTDVEEQRRLEESLRASQRQTAESLALLETLLATAPVGFGFIDREFRQVRINQALAATSGIPAGEQVGRLVPEMIPELWPELEPVYRRVLETGEAVVNRETSGKLRGDPDQEHTWLASFYPVRLEEEVIGIGTVVMDITERKEAELRLKHLSEHDPLTGIYNRRKLFDELDRILRYSGRYERSGAVLMLDVDNFKWTNDSYGHATGDQQLRSVAQILTGRLRTTDIVARSGGDEFAAVLPEATEQQALAVARDIRSLLCERPIGPPVYVSIGIAQFNGSGELTVDDVLVAADMAMYQVKNAGGDAATIYQWPSVELLTRVGAIQKALAEGRFVLHRQPIFDLHTNDLVFSELLIRMRADSGEIISPGEFLPLAERFSLIVPIDRHVVEKALGLARHSPVSVNLSGRSVGDPMILTAIRQAVATGVDPGNLVIELTETAVMTDFERALQFAAALDDLGCPLALDDFGTGFGSFTYLKHLPTRHLKIDMEFVRDVNTDPTDREIIRSIVGIAHTLGKLTTAEGVESKEVLDALRELGVDYAQGFYLGRPEPIVEPG
jgi:diguanylate cyclase (GGDEF)-like protein/PAS domain S-box-containing protein